MWKKVIISTYIAAGLIGCEEKTAITITVQADPAALQGQEIQSLRVMLSQLGESASEVFDNEGKPITFPVTLSTRVNADRLGDLRVAVAGLDDVGNSVLSGVANLPLSGGEFQNVQVQINDPNPQNAGDGIDATSCLDLIDNDGNGVIDCQEPACQQLLPELCAGARCGDGVRNALALEHCDDGNQENGDSCASNCVSNDRQFTFVMEYAQVADVEFGGGDLSFQIADPLQTKAGFLAETPLPGGDCFRLDLLVPTFNLGLDGVEFFFADYGTWQILDEQGAPLRNVTPVQGQGIFFDIANGPLFSDAQPISMSLSGDADPFAAIDAPREILPLTPFPTRLDVPVIQSNLAVVRGQDFVVTWPPGPADEDAVVFVFGGNGVQAICTAPSSAGTVTVPGAFTAALPRGDSIQDGTGFGIQISNGFFQKIEIPFDETTSTTIDQVNATLFLTVENGALFNGAVF